MAHFGQPWPKPSKLGQSRSSCCLLLALEILRAGQLASEARISADCIRLLFSKSAFVTRLNILFDQSPKFVNQSTSEFDLFLWIQEGRQSNTTLSASRGTAKSPASRAARWLASLLAPGEPPGQPGPGRTSRCATAKQREELAARLAPCGPRGQRSILRRSPAPGAFVRQVFGNSATSEPAGLAGGNFPGRACRALDRYLPGNTVLAAITGLRRRHRHTRLLGRGGWAAEVRTSTTEAASHVSAPRLVQANLFQRRSPLAGVSNRAASMRRHTQEERSGSNCGPIGS